MAHLAKSGTGWQVTFNGGTQWHANKIPAAALVAALNAKTVSHYTQMANRALPMSTTSHADLQAAAYAILHTHTPQQLYDWAASYQQS